MIKEIQEIKKSCTQEIWKKISQIVALVYGLYFLTVRGPKPYKLHKYIITPYKRLVKDGVWIKFVEMKKILEHDLDEIAEEYLGFK